MVEKAKAIVPYEFDYAYAEADKSVEYYDIHLARVSPCPGFDNGHICGAGETAEAAYMDLLTEINRYEMEKQLWEMKRKRESEQSGAGC